MLKLFYVVGLGGREEGRKSHEGGSKLHKA